MQNLIRTGQSILIVNAVRTTTNEERKPIGIWNFGQNSDTQDRISFTGIKFVGDLLDIEDTMKQKYDVIICMEWIDTLYPVSFLFRLRELLNQNGKLCFCIKDTFLPYTLMRDKLEKMNLKHIAEEIKNGYYMGIWTQ